MEIKVYSSWIRVQRVRSGHFVSLIPIPNSHQRPLRSIFGLMKKFADQTGKVILLDHSPSRIISVVPSQTELLYDLGLDLEVVGITKFCVHPDVWFKKKTRIGGTKALNLDLIVQLAPDLIIANKEENLKEQVDELEKFCPVWTSNIRSIPEALDMILTIGSITQTFENARLVTEKIKASFSGLQAKNPNSKTECRGTAYAIWRNPLMVAGGDTFIGEMMRLCGFRNIFEEKKRYPEVTIAELRSFECELLLLSSEPFPFKEEHAADFRMLLPQTQIRLVDGEMFGWYGSRMQYAAAYFEQLISHVFHNGAGPGSI